MTNEPANRIEILDLIRGIAVLGILAANIVAFGQPWSAYMFPDAFMVPTQDDGGWLWLAQFVLIDGKMRGIFTLLFGVGVYIFMERAWAKGFTSLLQVRRLFFLLLFGLLHFFFFFKGDILVSYAISGLFVLAFIRWKPKSLFKLGISIYLIGTIIYIAMVLPLHLVADTSLGESAAMTEFRSELEEGKKEAIAADLIEANLKRSGDYRTLIFHRLANDSFFPLTNAIFFFFEAFPLMLLGVALYKAGFFSGAFQNARLRFWAWFAFIIGALFHLGIGLWVKFTDFTYYGTLAAFVGLSSFPRLLMSVGVLSLLVQKSDKWHGWVAQRFIAAGRVAFSNYIGTSAVMLVIFHGWGLGFYGELNRPQLLCITVLAWVAMLFWSKLWLNHYRYGPLEWLWRCLTYGKIFPSKR